jgi:hypothetical protein
MPALSINTTKAGKDGELLELVIKRNGWKVGIKTIIKLGNIREQWRSIILV